MHTLTQPSNFCAAFAVKRNPLRRFLYEAGFRSPLEEEIATGYAPGVAVGAGSFGAVAPPIPPPFGPR
jgi:hypothetical protein